MTTPITCSTPLKRHLEIDADEETRSPKRSKKDDRRHVKHLTSQGLKQLKDPSSFEERKTVQSALGCTTGTLTRSYQRHAETYYKNSPLSIDNYYWPLKITRVIQIHPNPLIQRVATRIFKHDIADIHDHYESERSKEMKALYFSCTSCNPKGDLTKERTEIFAEKNHRRNATGRGSNRS